MRIIVVGAGEVGYHLAMRLSEERHDVVVIERDPELVGRIQAQLDVLVIEGNGASLDALEKAGVDGADLLRLLPDPGLEGLHESSCCDHVSPSFGVQT